MSLNFLTSRSQPTQTAAGKDTPSAPWRAALSVAVVDDFFYLISSENDGRKTAISRIMGATRDDFIKYPRTPQEAFCMMATNVATALEIEREDPIDLQSDPFCALHSPLSTSKVRPVPWDEWIRLPVREQDNAVRTVRGAIRVPTVIVAVNYARVPKKRPKLCARNIRDRDGNRCQYTGKLLKPDEGSLDHVVPRSRGGKDTWENLVWSSKVVNTRKGNRLPHEAGLKLLSTPRAPRELPAMAFIRNSHDVADWKLFAEE